MALSHFLYKKWKITLPVWSIISPLIGLILLALAGEQRSGIFAAIMGASLITVVLSAVHHAEVMAHKVGEPYGTLILALAITVIEVSLIVSVMLTEVGQDSTLARDTVFAAIMLISLNLALGSALASIGLTIPAVAIVCYFAGFRVTLGIDAKSTLLLILSLFTISISFNAGKTNILQGIVLLVILATYMFISVLP